MATSPASPTTSRAAGKREPIRTCVGCRRKAPQSELVRFVLGPEGNPVEGRTLPGRGAWLCQVTLDECRALAERRKAFSRAFRTAGRPSGGR